MVARWILIAGLLMIAAAGDAVAEEAVKIGNAYALLNKPASPQAAVILIPGGHGRLDIRLDGSFGALRGNQLVRTPIWPRALRR